MLFNFMFESMYINLMGFIKFFFIEKPIQEKNGSKARTKRHL